MVMTCIIDNQYVNWLRQEHPYSLLNGLFNIEQIDTCIHLRTMTDTLEPSTMANTEGQEETTK